MGNKGELYLDGNCVSCGMYGGSSCMKDFPILLEVSPNDTCPDYEDNDYRFNIKNKERQYNGNKRRKEEY